MRIVIAALAGLLVVGQSGLAFGQAPIPNSPPNRINAGFGGLFYMPARILDGPGPQPDVQVLPTLCGDLFLGYTRDVDERWSLSASVHFMSIPAKFQFQRYEFLDTMDSISGPLGRSVIGAGDWQRTGLRVVLERILLERPRSNWYAGFGGMATQVLDGQHHYLLADGDPSEPYPLQLRVDGTFSSKWMWGWAGKLGCSTSSRNSNGVEFSLYGAWFPNGYFNGLIRSLPGTNQEERATYRQSQSFIGLSVSIYKSWGPPKVPMRLRKDREP